METITPLVAPVSAVIPCYNGERTVERAIRSVSRQTLRPKELIVIDDKSTDQTPAVLERLQQEFGPGWLRIITHQTNEGPSVSRNHGWDAASQEYVAFLDADDVWDENKIAIQLAYMQQHRCAISAHQYALNKKESVGDISNPEVQHIAPWMWLLKNYYSVQAVMVRQEVPLRFIPGRHYSEDYSLWLRLAFSGYQMPLLQVCLAHGFKQHLAEYGLSSKLWAMEKAQLEDFFSLYRSGKITLGQLAVAEGWSLVKHIKRVFTTLLWK